MGRATMLSAIDRRNPLANLSDRDASAARTFADYRDLALVDAAHEVVLAAERIAVLETDLAVYGELLRAALDALQKHVVRYERLRQQHDQLADDYRRFRVDALLAADGDA